MDNYYKTLGVEPTATEAEIKKAYRELAKKYHPDATEFGTKFSEAEMKRINEAFSTLSDSDARLRYDAYLRGTSQQATQKATQGNNTQQSSSESNTYNQQQQSTNTYNSNTASKTSSNTGFKIFTVLLLLLAIVTFGLDCAKPVNYRPLQQQKVQQIKQKHAKNKKRRTKKKRKAKNSKSGSNTKQNSVNETNGTQTTETNDAAQQQNTTVQPNKSSDEEAARLRREENLRRIQEAQ